MFVRSLGFGRGQRVGVDRTVDAYARRLAARALVGAGVIRQDGGYDHDVSAAVFDQVVGEAGKRARTRKSSVTAQKRALVKLEREPLSRVAPLFLNAEWLAGSLGLTDVERAVFEFVLMADCSPVLARALALCEGCTSVEEIVATALCLELAAVRETLDRKSVV